MINKKHIDIFYSEKFVESEIFNREMIRADILISPIIENYRSRTVVEKYTHTKATGGFHDAFSYYKPMIVPKTYNIYPDFKDCFISYRDEEHLLTIIKDLSKNRYKIDSAINAVINAYSIYDEKYIKKCIRSIIYNSN